MAARLENMNNRREKQSWWWLLFLLLMVTDCTEAWTESRVTVRYSKGFTVEYHDGLTLVSVTNPWQGANTGFKYLLKDRGSPTPQGYSNYQVVEVPVRKMVALSTTMLAFIEQMELVDHLTGFSDLEGVHSQLVRKAAAQGRITTVGQGTNLQLETLLDLGPDLIFTFATGSFRDTHPKLREAGLKVAIIAEYMETHPLGRAEWLKFISLFFDKGGEAEQLFNAIEARYLALAKLTNNISKRPTVFTGVPFSGHWYVPGGNSFVAKFLEDGGGDYIWKHTEHRGSLPMDIELVYDQAIGADYWLNPGTWSSLDQARLADQRFTAFNALASGRLFNHNKRVNAAGGNDYWESGMVKPDVVLADLIRILHPELLPDHQLFYYTHLQ